MNRLRSGKISRRRSPQVRRLCWRLQNCDGPAQCPHLPARRLLRKATSAAVNSPGSGAAPGITGLGRQDAAGIRSVSEDRRSSRPVLSSVEGGIVAWKRTVRLAMSYSARAWQTASFQHSGRTSCLLQHRPSSVALKCLAQAVTTSRCSGKWRGWRYCARYPTLLEVGLKPSILRSGRVSMRQVIGDIARRISRRHRSLIGSCELDYQRRGGGQLPWPVWRRSSTGSLWLARATPAGGARLLLAGSSRTALSCPTLIEPSQAIRLAASGARRDSICSRATRAPTPSRAWAGLRLRQGIRAGAPCPC
jgi:hypothetical protein